MQSSLLLHISSWISIGESRPFLRGMSKETQMRMMSIEYGNDYNRTP